MAQIYGFYAYRQARGRKFSAAGRCPPPPAGGWGGLARVQGLAAVLTAPAKAFGDCADIIVFIFITGAIFTILERTP